MVIVYSILIGILMSKLGKKGKAYREEKRMAEFGPTAAQIKEDAYRRKLEREGLDDDLITIILPVVMNTK